jgi:RNA ligase
MDSYAYQFDIPVVGTFDSTVDLAAFVDYVHDLEDEEGYVIRFDSGMMLKQKSKWYVQIHKAKEAILQDRNIVQLILEEKLDDIKSHLLDSDYNRLTHFENDFNYAINEVVNNIQWEIQDLVRMEIDRKTFALEYAPYTDQYTKQIIFSLWDDFATITRNDIVNKVHNTIMNNLTKTVKYEAIRDAWFPGLFYNT